MNPIPLADADWIYQTVLTATYRRSVGAEGRGANHKDEDLALGPAAVRMCPCQWGPCGHCSAGRPDRCAHRRGVAPVRPFEESVVSRAGHFLANAGMSGTPCRWRCPGPPVDAQLELFDLVGGAR